MASRGGDDGPGGPRRRRSPVLLATLALLLFVLAAAALPEGLSPFDDSGSDRLVLPSIPAALRFLIAGVAALLVLTLVLLRVTVLRSEGAPKRTTKSRWRVLALVLIALALWATFASFRQDQATSEDGSPFDLATPSPNAEGAAGGEESEPPTYSEPFGIVVGSLFVLALGSATVALLLLFRKMDEDDGDGTLEAKLIDELDAGLDDLRGIDDPRAAVIACYSRMEKVVHLAGVHPAPSDTPFQLLGRILEKAEVSVGSARRLTELFEEAKFSIRPIDEPMRQEALVALIAVREEIASKRQEVSTS